MKKELILNLGCGKNVPMDLPEKFDLINIDSSMYRVHSEEEIFKKILEENDVNQIFFFNDDAPSFLEQCPIKFDKIVMYRFLEHISRKNLLYFIYILAGALKENGEMDIIVPDHQKLAKKLAEETEQDMEDINHDITITTEFLNEPSDPHGSLWSPLRAKYYLELENRFDVTRIYRNFEYDGRNTHIRIIAKRR